MHAVIFCLCVVIVAQAVRYSIKRRLDRDRLAAVEDRLSVAEWLIEDNARIERDHHAAAQRRLGKLEVSTRCRRIHAADLPPGMVRAPTRAAPDEELFNPLLK